MRFYDPEDPDPKPVDSLLVFPKCEEAEGSTRCLKIGLVPSVTNVLSVIRQEYLERWKMSEAVKNFRRHGNAWMAVEEIFGSNSREAEFGTQVHEVVHNWLTGKPMVKGKPLDHAMPLLGWLNTRMREMVLSEESMACRKTGAGGTIDLAFIDKAGLPVLGDIKVVKYSSRFPLKTPTGYRAQLSAYEMMLRARGHPPQTRMSFYLASPFGDDPRPKLTVFEYQQDYEAEFKAALCLWHAEWGDRHESPAIWTEKKENTFSPAPRG